MLKRVISCILVFALMLSALPVSAFARTGGIHYGDADQDGQIGLNDILAMKQYIAEEAPSTFSTENADVDCDGAVGLSDLLLLKKYLAEWEVVLGPGKLTVRFCDGERLIEEFQVEPGEPLGTTPSVEKTSKADGIFVGWYLDEAFTQPFYSANPITENTVVYAKYDAVPGIEEVLTIDSFSKTDVDPYYTLTIQGSGDTAEAVTLLAKDGTEAPALNITANGGGTFTVQAEGGFRPGSSYELVLAQGFNFVGDSGEMPDTVRTASFTVKKEIVDNMKLNEDIVYIADTAAISYAGVDSDGDGVYGETVDALTSQMGLNPSGVRASVAEADSLGLEAGDILCFYVGTAPKDRVYTGPSASAYPGEPEVYVKVLEATGEAILFTAIPQEDISQVYDIPDVFPLKGTAADNQINISALDLSIYAQFGVETPTQEYALERLAVGDFVAVFENEEDEAALGKITAFDPATGEITFEPCTENDIIGSRSVYVQPAMRGDDLVSQEARQEIEATMLAQIRESGFAEEAAYTLATLATKTDGFQNMDGLREVLLKDESGEPLSSQEIELLSLGASFELSEDVELSVELITDGDELHFADGVQLAVGIEAGFEVEAEDGTVAIQLKATFIEELEIKPTVDGELTYKRILGVPIPNGVRIAASIDVMNYTAYDFDVTAYTVEEEDQSVWDKFKKVMENPSDITTMLSDSGLIPEKYKGTLKKVGDVFDQIREVEKKISDAESKYEETAETVEGYQEDLEALWAVVEDMHQQDTQGQLFTRETWAQAAKDLSRTNIAQELLHLTEDGITDGDAGVDNDVSIKSVEELMERYAEMLQQETDWVTLLDQKVCEAGGGIYVVNFMVKVDFIIRANMSIALGSTLEYECGKRYNFWFKVGLYKPTGGSSTMDLIDESLAFQFYVMGKLEIKMGAKITLGINLGCSDVAYVGIYSEVGPFVKLYGFFVYTFQQLRQANTLTPVKTVRKMGALYLETGIYLIVGVEASAAMGIFEASYDFLDTEFPILNAGSNEFPYAFTYELQPDEKIVIRDSDGNSSNGVTMVLPEELRAVRTMILNEGVSVDRIYDYTDYNISLSNPNFSLDRETGEILVTVPDGVRSMDCELRLTFRHGKMAFSDHDIAISIPLFWTNLAASELSEYYTASVRVGNDSDGYQTVWSKRFLKNTAFELPTAEEVMKLIGYSPLKYTSGGYAEQYDTSSGIIDSKVYDFQVTPRLYSITVNGIQGAAASQTFTAKLGERFDFSSLAGTGANDPGNGNFTIFQNVSTSATVTVGTDSAGNPIVEPVNLASPITNRVAEALAGGITATANYADNAVTAVFTFAGLDHADMEQTLCKGGTVDITAIEDLAAENGLAVKEISPAIAPLYATTLYTVTLGELEGEEFTVSFEENGGSEVEDITKVGGSLLGALPETTREGYQFEGWYLDDGTFLEQFGETLMPKEDTTLYAKWTAKQYTVSFHINGGTSETPESRTLDFGSAYGELPTPERTGYGFIGWFTQQEEGVQISGTDLVTVAEDHTLYARWQLLKEIPKDIFSFTKPENPTYDPNAAFDNAGNLTFTPQAGETYQLSDFTIEYKLDGGSGDYVAMPQDAGAYIARISRPGDNTYAKFEATYTDVLTINKAQGQILDPTSIMTKITAQSFYSNLILDNTIARDVDYIGDEGCFQYGVSNYSTDDKYVHWSDSNLITNIFDDKNISLSETLYVWVRLAEGPNYLGDPSVVINPTPVTVSIPTSMWSDASLTYRVTIKTSDKSNAGTDAMIWTSFDACGDEYSRWDSISGKNFERNHTDTMMVSAGGTDFTHRNSAETIRMKLKFVPKHSAAGWHCEWIRLDVLCNGVEVYTGDQISVNRWFEDTEVVSYTMTTAGGYVHSDVELVGYDTLPEQAAASGDAFSWSWDGSMRSNLSGGVAFNAYERINAPVLSAAFVNSDYNRFITRTINGFTVDRAGLAQAMQANGETTAVLKTAFEFQAMDGKYTVSEACRRFTRNVTFTLG